MAALAVVHRSRRAETIDPVNTSRRIEVVAFGDAEFLLCSDKMVFAEPDIATDRNMLERDCGTMAGDP